MVNNTKSVKVSLPPFDGVNRYIGTKPLYDLADIKTIVKDRSHIYLVTEKCISDVAGLGFDDEDIALLIEGLEPKHYLKSEWCMTKGNAHRPCDAYACTVLEYYEDTNRKVASEYYLKFATNNDGSLLLMVSCHL